MSYKTKLSDNFENTGKLINHIEVSTILIPKMEIYGYVPDDPLFVEVDLDASHRIVCSDRIFQLRYVNERQSNTTTWRLTRVTIPIYPTILVEKKDRELLLKNLYIPSLIDNDLYIKIRMRRGDKDYQTSEYELKRNKMPDNVFTIDKIAYYKTCTNELICLDKDGEIKCVCNNIMAVCRYNNPINGALNYTILPLTDILVDSEETVYF